MIYINNIKKIKAIRNIAFLILSFIIAGLFLKVLHSEFGHHQSILNDLLFWFLLLCFFVNLYLLNSMKNFIYEDSGVVVTIKNNSITKKKLLLLEIPKEKLNHVQICRRFIFFYLLKLSIFSQSRKNYIHYSFIIYGLSRKQVHALKASTYKITAKASN